MSLYLDWQSLVKKSVRYLDLQDGKRSELVLLLSYTELLKVQPIGKSEVPVGYLEMLKW